MISDGEANEFFVVPFVYTSNKRFGKSFYIEDFSRI